MSRSEPEVYEDDEYGWEDDDFPAPAIYPASFPIERVDPDAVKVLRRLNRSGHIAYLVGGGVRDILLGHSPKDFDVATSARPNEVRRLFRNCRVIGRRFRLAHILFAGDKIIECATFRKDPSQRYDLLPADIAPGLELLGEETPVKLVPRRTEEHDKGDLLIKNDNIFGEPHEDAIRRDFTVNGLFYDIEENEIIDYVGGMADLDRRVMRMIGDPDVRFREDPIRIMRAIKFSARLDMGIDPEVYDAMVDHRGELARAAAPRVLEEILRFMRGGKGKRSIYLTWDIGVLAEILPELASYLDDDPPEAELTWLRLAAIERRQREGATLNDAVMLSALLFGALHEAMDGMRDQNAAFDDFMDGLAHRLAIPRRMKDRIRGIVTSQRRLSSGKLGALPRRDFFADAATLYALDCEARGLEIPEWAVDPKEVPLGDGSRRRRRRRRR